MIIGGGFSLLQEAFFTRRSRLCTEQREKRTYRQECDAMKIGIVSSYFYPWYGGITEHVYHQYKELKARGHEAKLITPLMAAGFFRTAET